MQVAGAFRTMQLRSLYETGGGYAEVLFECTGEVRVVVVAKGFGDLCKTFVSVADQVAL